MPANDEFDCYAPKQIADRIESLGVAKANSPLFQQTVLGLLGGAFIGLGAMVFTVIVSDARLSFAVARILGGVSFSLGLILVVIAGAELFTGNNLLIMSTVAGRVSTARFVRNMCVVYIANLVGAVGLAGLVLLSGEWRLGGATVGNAVLRIASEKCQIPLSEAFFRGVLCNMLVCLAVWLVQAGRSVIDKMAAILFPVTTFVACGFEHSVANMYFIPAGIFMSKLDFATTPLDISPPTWGGFLQNLIPVTLGNLVGGSGLVGLVYWAVYRRNQEICYRRDPQAS